MELNKVWAKSQNWLLRCLLRYLRLCCDKSQQWRKQAHFFALFCFVFILALPLRVRFPKWRDRSSATRHNKCLTGARTPDTLLDKSHRSCFALVAFEPPILSNDASLIQVVYVLLVCHNHYPALGLWERWILSQPSGRGQGTPPDLFVDLFV